MPIEWVFPGTTREQQQRALAAALEIFVTHHIQPEVAGFAKLEMQTYLSRGKRGPLPHKDSERGALIFERAQIAAALAALDAGAALEAQKQGYIRVDFEPAGWAAYFMRESRVLNWVDPEEKRDAAN